MFFCFRQSRALRRHSAALAQLRDTLLSNLSDDIWYEDFPALPPRSCKRRLSLAGYTVKLLFARRATGQRISLVVKQGGRFLGTLIHEESGKMLLILPKVEDQDIEADRLVAALNRIAAEDTALRTGSGTTRAA